MQIDGPSYIVDLWNWVLAPASTGGTQDTFSVVQQCPVDLPPGTFGYVLSLLFVAVLFVALLSIRRKKDGSAF